MPGLSGELIAAIPPLMWGVKMKTFHVWYLHALFRTVAEKSIAANSTQEAVNAVNTLPECGRVISVAEYKDDWN
jgi:hypothetical protein